MLHFRPSKGYFYFSLYCMILVVVFGIHYTFGMHEMRVFWLIFAFLLQASIWFYLHIRQKAIDEKRKADKKAKIR